MLYIRSLEHTHLITQSVYPLPLFILHTQTLETIFSLFYHELYILFSIFFKLWGMNKTVRNVSLANFTLHHVFKVYSHWYKWEDSLLFQSQILIHCVCVCAHACTYLNLPSGHPIVCLHVFKSNAFQDPLVPSEMLGGEEFFQSHYSQTPQNEATWQTAFHLMLTNRPGSDDKQLFKEAKESK